jgi:chromosome segregation ATPase
MYEELLEECEKKKELMKKLDENEQKLKSTKDQLKKKTDEVFFLKRKLENLQYSLAGLIKNIRIQEWPTALREIYIEHFGEDDMLKEIESENNGIDPSAPVSGMDFNGGEEIEYTNIKDELIRQKTWMNNKLKSI